MSSLAAARADNFYYPPTWEPKRGGLNKFHGTHALGDRAKLRGLGITVIRFEIPYNAWCEGCKKHIAKGDRYNADKYAVDKYYSTTIWEFSMKCHLCDQVFKIRTDPEGRDYKFVEGVTKKADAEACDEKDSERIVVGDEKSDLIRADPMARLEHEKEDMAVAKASVSALTQAQEIQERASRDYDLNALARKRARGQRAADAANLAESRSKGLSVALVPRSTEDTDAALRARYARATQDTATLDRAAKRRMIASQDIFGAPIPAAKAKALAAVDRAVRARVDTRNFLPPSSSTFGPERPPVVPSTKIVGRR